MTFQPVVPLGGLNGWIFLQRTAEVQQETYSNSGLIARETEDFRSRIGEVQTAEALVADRILLKVALGAFGLSEDIDNKFFIQTVLSEGATDDGSLANKLADKRYLEFAKAFGFGEERAPLTSEPGFADTIVNAYETRSFEEAVGEQDENMRLALGLERELGTIAERSVSNDTKWFSIMGNPPLRAVFETTFSLPSSFGTLPIDQQLETLKDRAQSILGSDDVSNFSNEEALDDLTNKFLLNAQVQAFQAAQGGSAALTLLQNIPRLNLV
ncbi:DUF1217 domain-containing protein [Litoreibacter roseus]|uniref:Flagellar basal body rod protein FlgF n=1 Tax=Litoreibacter roseus TaxID=2601869 RepID=A0A6N6JEN8_9RHOB|nr:DUF1217 domain-containing protein [Litoreibacter roseus]GFE64417.1 flagellar basal body rod protein FlgF [Litoreibacter roseus]